MAAGLYLIGVPNALLWGALTILLRFIPYLGPLLAAAGPIVLSIAVFAGWSEPLMAIGLIVDARAHQQQRARAAPVRRRASASRRSR